MNYFQNIYLFMIVCALRYVYISNDVTGVVMRRYGIKNNLLSTRVQTTYHWDIAVTFVSNPSERIAL